MVAKKRNKGNVFNLKTSAQLKSILEETTHVYHGGACCETDTKGFATSNNRAITEIVVDATQGFIPLWDRNVTLNWRFQEASLLQFADPDAVKAYIRTLFWRNVAQMGECRSDQIFRDVRTLGFRDRRKD